MHIRTIMMLKVPTYLDDASINDWMLVHKDV